LFLSSVLLPDGAGAGAGVVGGGVSVHSSGGIVLFVFGSNVGYGISLSFNSTITTGIHFPSSFSHLIFSLVPFFSLLIYMHIR
tara:strand:- start:246 stop:494 length:249 start_codon:yes stop_codon:yes gene_type:complete